MSKHVEATSPYIRAVFWITLKHALDCHDRFLFIIVALAAFAPMIVAKSAYPQDIGPQRGPSSGSVASRQKPFMGGGSCEPLTDAPDTAGAKLALVKVSPKSGSTVSKTSAIVASLRYSIPNYIEGRYTLIAQFQTTTPGVMYDGPFPNDHYPRARGATGVFSLYFPLEKMWEVSRISRPVRINFFLLEGTSSRRLVVATSEWIEFRTQ